jgi:sporulation protein YlmC with PRC-barrel domain
VIRLCELRDKKLRSLDGERLGRVHEVHCKGGKVVALMCGPGSLIERWTGRKQGRRIPWKAVRRIEHDAIIIAPAAAKPKR